jgi:tetratricopeptide (TPR) repeat protein
MRPGVTFNPFPGLRSFEPEEDHLFFGREKEIDELLRRLRTTRFLPVIGTSGSGKSSLVRSGLIPALQSGFMVKAGSNWRVPKFRPSDDPIGNLAESLNAPDALGTQGELASTNRILLEATLRRGTRGLVDAVRQARIPPHDNLLVVVDQFEELFRFRRSRNIENSKDEAITFVKLLLEATQQDEFPIYVVLTMRSDFIGDCMEYPGLPEAVNAGQYLVPRMTRDELRSAITGPVAVGGGEIAKRLVLRLLNDLGDDQDQLPVLQHALMRSWDHWTKHGLPNEPIDIADYEAIGTLRQALSLHAEEAYEETGSDLRRKIAEQIFKALTDTFTDQRGVRRPTSVRELAAICEVTESNIVPILEIFRRPGCSFLMPPATVPLDSNSVIDISHESLMRCWTRLIGWAEEERTSAELYARLSQAAAWFEEGKGGLWRNPELELGLQWKQQSRPTAAWAERYGGSFDRAVKFLDRSAFERERYVARREEERKRKLRQAQWAAGVLAALLVMAGALAYVARKENARAEQNLHLAQNAVDAMLSSAGSKQARVAEDVPEMEEFRRELLEKARAFYSIFVKQKPKSEEIRMEMARSHFRLGDIDRLLEKSGDAIEEYQQAIAQFKSLAADYPHEPLYRQSLANTFNWLGETLRVRTETRPQAEAAYNNALSLQQVLARESPENQQYERELARTHYNRGILRYFLGHLDGSEADFREAIRLLQPLAAKEPDSPAAQELARAYNDLGNLLRHEDHLPEAKEFYEAAIQIHEGLTQRKPDDREYKQELAVFDNNLAMLLLDQQQYDLAKQRNHRALELIEDLARPAPSLGMELTNAQSFRCQLLETQGSGNALAECQQAFDLLEALGHAPESRNRPEIHRLARDLGYNYLGLAQNSLKSGALGEARTALGNLSRLLPEISEPDRSNLSESFRVMQQRLHGKKAKDN